MMGFASLYPSYEFAPLHRVKRPDRRQIAVEPLHLHRRDLPGAALRKGRRPHIARQYVWIAVDAERRLFLGVHRVVPGAGRELDDAGGDGVGDVHGGETGASDVEEANDVAVGDAAGLSPQLLLFPICRLAELRRQCWTAPSP
jgi:hypothetical protein